MLDFNPTMTDDDAQAYARNLAAETPAKLWWHLPYNDPLIARALRVDTTEPDTWYAVWPFRYTHSDGRHLIIAAYPPPRVLDNIDVDWLQIGQTIAWEPRTNAVEIMDDNHPQIVGRMADDSAAIYTDPRAFFAAWAARRARYLALRRQNRVHRTAEPDLVPGMLVVGDIDRIAWPLYDMAPRFKTIGVDTKTVNRAILNFAKLPMAIGDRHNGNHV